MSCAVSMRPDLYAAYLHGASQWDGTYAPIADNRVAVYICMAENDEYYGSEKARPDEIVTRTMLATILYRIAGSPAVTGTDTFSDTATDAYYTDAVVWANANGIVSGYGNGLFGTNDPVSRQQIAAILWRYAGRPSADAGQDFTDDSTIAAMRPPQWIGPERAVS